MAWAAGRTWPCVRPRQPGQRGAPPQLCAQPQRFGHGPFRSLGSDGSEALVLCSAVGVGGLGSEALLLSAAPGLGDPSSEALNLSLGSLGASCSWATQPLSEAFLPSLAFGLGISGSEALLLGL